MGLKAGRERSLARERRKGRCRFPLPHMGLGSSPRPARPRPRTGSSESAGSRLRLLSLRALLGFCKEGRLPWPQMGAGRAFRRAAQLASFCKRPARLAWRSRPGTKAAIWGSDQGCGGAGDGHPCLPPALSGLPLCCIAAVSAARAQNCGATPEQEGERRQTRFVAAKSIQGIPLQGTDRPAGTPKMP